MGEQTPEDIINKKYQDRLADLEYEYHLKMKDLREEKDKILATIRQNAANGQQVSIGYVGEASIVIVGVPGKSPLIIS